jgi:putative tryptophan/tyrosine transport system substrate-binding protein
MNRRAFIYALGSMATCPFAALAQQPPRVWRIGWLSLGAGPSALTQSFLQGMRELGYVEGQNFVVEYRWATGKDERITEFAADLVRKGVDLIVTAGTSAALAAKQATTTVPIVFASAGAPVEKGIVSSLAHPGGNVTGLALLTDDVKAVQILQEAAPRISHVAFIYNPNTLPSQFGETWLSRAKARSGTLKLDFQPVALRNPNEADRVFASLPAGVDALLIENSATNALARRQICSLAAHRRIPAVSTERAFAYAGCLLSYGEDQRDMHRRAATYVDKIFRGATPSDLPVEQPTKFELFINLKTAKTLGIDIPPTLLARAEQVIE